MTTSFEAFYAEVVQRLRLDDPPPPDRGLGLFDDLALDSLQGFELLVIVEGMADALVPPMDLPLLLTVGDAFDYFDRLRRSPT